MHGRILELTLSFIADWQTNIRAGNRNSRKKKHFEKKAR
jgi:hypothetical protein